MLGRWVLSLVFVALAVSSPAQDRGSLMPVLRPPITNPDDPKLPAKQLFGRKEPPAPMAARSIGGYSRGCLAGGTMLPVTGPTWQAMRLSRNRNWAHPEMITVIERISE